MELDGLRLDHGELFGRSDIESVEDAADRLALLEWESAVQIHIAERRRKVLEALLVELSGNPRRTLALIRDGVRIANVVVIRKNLFALVDISDVCSGL
jgi:hypothetical protein